MSDIVEKKSAFVSYDGNDEKIKMISDAVNNLTEDVRHESVTFDESPRAYWLRNGDINFSLAENGGITRPTLYLGQVEYTDMEAYEETHENPFPVHALGDPIYFVDGYSDHDINDYYQRTAVSFPLNGLSAGSLYTISFDMSASWPYKITDCLRSDPDNPTRFGIVIHDSPNIDEYYTEEGSTLTYHGFHRVVANDNYVGNEVYDSYYPSLQYYSFPRDWNQISRKHVEFQFIAYENTYITYILDGFLTKAELIDAHGENWYDQNVKGFRLIEFYNFSISNYTQWAPLTIKQLYAYSSNNGWAALNQNDSRLFGLSAPVSSIGKNGDYYLQYSVEEISNFTVTANSSYGFVSDNIWKDSTGYNMSASTSESYYPAYIEYSISNLIASESYIFTYTVSKSETERYASGSMQVYSSVGPYDRTEGTGDVEKSIVAYGTSIALRLETDFNRDHYATLSTVINGLKGYKCSLQDIWYKLEGSWYKYKGPGGGSGSNVTITPSLLSGTPIASYTIGENTSGTLYAPTPTTVTANPVSQATANLNKLLVDQTTYTVPSVYSGTTQPVSSKENDIYAKTASALPYMHPTSVGVVDNEERDYNNNTISVYGSVTDEFKDTYVYIVEGLIVGNEYTFSCSFQQDGDPTKVWTTGNHRNCICMFYPLSDTSADIGISATGGDVSTTTYGKAVTLYDDVNVHTYTFDFTATNSTMYLELFLTKYKNGTQYGGVDRNIEWLDISIAGDGTDVKGLYLNKGGNLNLIKGVREIVQKNTEGDILATVLNNDGTTVDIYGSNSGGGGGGGSKSINERIYQGDGTSNAATVELSKPYTGYDFLIVRTTRNADGRWYKDDDIFECKNLESGEYIQGIGWAGTNNYWTYQITDSTTLTRIAQGSNFFLYEIYGVKLGSGGGSGGGKPTKTNLYNTETTSTNVEITLSDNISSYDEIEFVVGFSTSDASKVSFYYSVDSFKNDFPYTGSTSINNSQFITTVYDNYFMCFQCGSSDSKIYIVRSSSTKLYEINGIKYESGGEVEGRTKELIWGNETITYPATKVTDAVLTHDIKDYDEIEIISGWKLQNVECIKEHVIEASELDAIPTASNLLDKQFLLAHNDDAQQWIRASKGSADNIIHFMYDTDYCGIYKIYGVKYSGGGGGGSGSSTLSGLSDVNTSSPTDGQVLVYDVIEQKWKNGNQSGGATVVANPSEVATQTLTKIKIGNTVYEIPQGGGGGSTESIFNFVTPGYSESISGEYIDYEIS